MQQISRFLFPLADVSSLLAVSFHASRFPCRCYFPLKRWPTRNPPVRSHFFDWAFGRSFRFFFQQRPQRRLLSCWDCTLVNTTKQRTLILGFVSNRDVVNFWGVVNRFCCIRFENKPKGRFVQTIFQGFYFLLVLWTKLHTPSYKNVVPDI